MAGIRWRASVGVVVLAVVIGSAPTAARAAEPPPHAAANESAWTVTRTEAGWKLTWHGDTELRIGAAPLVVRSGDVTVGTARENGTDAEIELSAPPPPIATLSLWKGNERVDVESATTSRRRTTIAGPTERFGAPAPVDPGRPGPYATERRGYRLAGLPWREYEAPIEVVGELTVPLGAPGERPLVLILHGRHSTCYRGGPDGESSGDWPCPDGWKSIPSHRGYRTITDLLASQGNVVVSIAANGINGQDWVSPDGGAAARSALIRHHLARFADWNEHGNDPWHGWLRGRVDLDQVVLVGHSRGGEGVARATIDSRAHDPWRIRGIVPIGPTAFGAQVPAQVQVAVLLPYCDGDVSDLQGQLYVDGARDLLRGADPSLRSAVMVYGANHNFFNAEWTPGLAAAPAWDDWWAEEGDNSWCSPTGGHRLAPLDQQRVGATYTAALVQLALHRDRRMLELLDGPASAPASAAYAHVRVTALGGDRTIAWRATRHNPPRVTGALGVEYCRGLQPRPSEQCNPGSPHWPWGEVPTLNTHHLTWSGDGVARFELPRVVDLRGRRRLDLRIAMGVTTTPTAFRLVIVDANGIRREVPVRPSPLGPTPGPSDVRKAWARALRADLKNLHDLRGFDRSRIVAIELATTGAGDAFVFDIAAVGAKVPRVTPTFLPLLDVGTVVVDEGDEPGRVAEVPVTVRGHFDEPVRYTLSMLDANWNQTWRTVTLAPGTRQFTIPIAFDGDTQPWGDRDLFVAAYAHRSGLTRNYLGGVHIVDDEEWPRLSVVDDEVTGTEAGGVTIQFRLSHAVDFDIETWAAFVPPIGGQPEIDSLDVTAETWSSWVWETPREPAVHPSDVGAFMMIVIPAGTTEFDLTVPFVVDGEVEGAESFSLVLFDGVDAELFVTATIND